MTQIKASDLADILKPYVTKWINDAVGTNPRSTSASSGNTGASPSTITLYTANESLGGMHTHELLATACPLTASPDYEMLLAVSASSFLYHLAGISIGSGSCPYLFEVNEYGSTSNIAIALKSPSTQHGMTAIAQTNVHGYLSKVSSSGGMMVRGMSAACTGLFLSGIGGAGDSAKSIDSNA